MNDRSSRLSPIITAIVAVLALSTTVGSAQDGPAFHIRTLAELYFPLDTYKDSLTGASKKLYGDLGYGSGASIEITATEWLRPFVRGMYVTIPYAGGSGSLAAGEGDVGIGLLVRPVDRLSLRLDAMGGLAELYFAGGGGTSFAAGARLGSGFRISPLLTLSASGGYSTYLGTTAPILSIFEAGIWFSLNLSAISGAKTKVSVENPRLDAVFPSLYAYYNDEPFGKVDIVNREDAAIRNVTISFNAPGFMDQPKVCATLEAIPKGGTIEVPIKALFNDSVLDITQGIDAKGEVIVKFNFLGSERSFRTPIDFRMHHRNAITWSDDRRAASFVSPKNPAALWFARFASGIVRDRLRGDINKPLQYAIGMFEAERLYGLNYVVVPANDYSVKHGIKDYIDSVQFPHQTLENRGGDCSDLAILFASLMQSVGIDAAFITIPGHIFAAFDTGLDEATARSTFYDQNLLIYREGRVWIPVEITMVADGFIKAWRVAAKEWIDNSVAGTVAFYTLPDCWKIYPPASFPGVNPRFNLPGEADSAVAFDASLDRFVVREIEGRVERLRVADKGMRPEQSANELGILYAEFGLLKQAWQSFSDSAKAQCLQAWTNLGNVAFLRKDYKLALTYYQYAWKNDPKSSQALLGKVRCEYELEDFEGSDADYARLKILDPSLAGKFGYLASIFGGQGRAFSLADRASSVTWAKIPAPALASAALPAAGPAESATVAKQGDSTKTAATNGIVSGSPTAISAAAPSDGLQEATKPEPVGSPALAATPMATLLPKATAEPAPLPAPQAALAPPPAATPMPVATPLPEATAEPAPLPAPQMALAPLPAASPSPVAAAEPVPAPTSETSSAALAEPAPTSLPQVPLVPTRIANPEVVSGIDETPASNAALSPEAQPTPALDISPAPAVEESPAPAVEESPAPAVEESPAPAAEESPAPAVEESLAPAVEASPAPAVEESPMPAMEESPAPAVEASPMPTPAPQTTNPNSAPFVETPSPGVAPIETAPSISAELPADLDLLQKADEQRRVAKALESENLAVEGKTSASKATPSPTTEKVETELSSSQLPALPAEPIVAEKPGERILSSAQTEQVQVPIPEIALAPEAGSAPEPEVAKAPTSTPEIAPVVEPVVEPAMEPAVEPAVEPADVPAPEPLPEASLRQAPANVAAQVPAPAILPALAFAETSEPDPMPTREAAPQPSLETAPMADLEPEDEPQIARGQASEASQVSAPEIVQALASDSPPASATAEAQAAASQESSTTVQTQSEVSPMPEAPVASEIASDLRSALIIVGQWTIEGGHARQTDGEAFFAKLAIPAVQALQPITYSFTAKSEARGRGWVGLGATLFAPRSGLIKGYGSGNSLLIWLTRDPVHFAENMTRLQVYRSVNSWKMVLIGETPVSESIFDANRFDIAVEPSGGTISVSLNGSERLAMKGITGLEAGAFVILRSLDGADFGDFRAESNR